MLCAMKDYRLPKKHLQILRLAHKGLKDRRKADRVKAIYLLGKGWSISDVTEALLLDEDTIRNYYARYEDGNLMGLVEDKYVNNKGLLSDKELLELETHLNEVTYQSAKEIMMQVKVEYDVDYSLSGIHELLKRLGFVYKKPQRCPGKYNNEVQEKFIKKYKKLRSNLGEKDRIYFTDTTHPEHQTQVSHGWIKRGEKKVIFTTAKQKRVNIQGALNINDLTVVSQFHTDSITAQSVIDFLFTLRAQQVEGWLHLICDNAKYYDNDEVRWYAKELGIKLHYLPAYSPNLNIIERLWKYFKKKALHNRYFRAFAEFEEACKDFFDKIDEHKAELKTLLTENFQKLRHA